MKKTNQVEDPQKSESKNPLVGYFFHTLKDGKIHWQGEIIECPQTGWYIVQTFEWLGGSPWSKFLIRIEDMAGWFFYESPEEMEFSYERGHARKFRHDT